MPSQLLTTGVCQHSSRTLAKTKRIGGRLSPEHQQHPLPIQIYTHRPPTPVTPLHARPHVSLKCFRNAACCTRLVNMAHFSPFVSLFFFFPSDPWPRREMQTWVLWMALGLALVLALALHMISKMFGESGSHWMGVLIRQIPAGFSILHFARKFRVSE